MKMKIKNIIPCNSYPHISAFFKSDSGQTTKKPIVCLALIRDFSDGLEEGYTEKIVGMCMSPSGEIFNPMEDKNFIKMIIEPV